MRSGNATTILLIVALIVGVASTILIIAVARSSPQPTTKATSLVPDQPLLPSVPKSTPSSQAKFTPPTASPTVVAPATSSAALTTVTNLSPGDVDTYTALSTDKTTFLIDFIATSFQPISLITYTINYTADVSGTATAKSIQGSFAPNSVLITGYKPSGYPYIRKSFTLGVCSGVTCTYDTNPRNFSVTVATK
jgi:hypothetical protein